MQRDLRRALVATFIARTIANAALRVVYPFLPAIARGLGVTPASVASAIALRNLGGFGTPLVARAAERHGRRSIMSGAMVAVAAGCFLTAATGELLVAAAGMVAVGFAKPAFDISMQAWFGDRVPYAERGRIFGITELTWSVAIVLVPLAALLIEATSWRAPFIVLGAAASVGAVLIRRGLDPDRPVEHVRRPVRLDRSAVALLLSVWLFSLASEMPFIVYGQWLESDFGLSIAGIGLFTLVIAVAELGGEGAVMAVSDRIGLKRMWLWGAIVSGGAYLALGAVGGSLAAAVGVVMIWIVAFEVTIVAAIPFASELKAESRDRFLSLFAVMVSAGRVAGALLAQPLFSAGDMGAVGAASAAAVFASAILLLFVPDHGQREDV
ncbi:MAG: MFS transporter [Actinomycetota bacterium]